MWFLFAKDIFWSSFRSILTVLIICAWYYVFLILFGIPDFKYLTITSNAEKILYDVLMRFPFSKKKKKSRENIFFLNGYFSFNPVFQIYVSVNING